jgi:hypothetical protein
VINARIDVFIPAAFTGLAGPRQGDLVPAALHRARAYLDAGVDCVYPIGLWEADALAAFLPACPGPVNVLRIPPAPSLAELAGLGVARISYAGLLHHGVIEKFRSVLAALAAERGLPAPVAVVYDAGPTGFGLARALHAAGISCRVAAPSKLQRPSGDRVKTDIRDARHLARLCHLDEVSEVAVPSGAPLEPWRHQL